MWIFVAVVRWWIAATAAGLLLTSQTEGADAATAELSPLHKANLGRVTFMPRYIPIEEYGEEDFVKRHELTPEVDLELRAFLPRALTSYLRELAPELSEEEANKKGNYRFTFLVDGELVYEENVHPGAGSAQAKSTNTILRIPLQSSTEEDSWGRFLWWRFLVNGGKDALGGGSHQLRVEIRSYVNNPDPRVGPVIATGELEIVTPLLPEGEAMDVAPLRPAAGWEVSPATFDRGRIRQLKQRIAGGVFKEVRSIVAVWEGRLLLEEYFHGADRETLHDTRSVGKSFASTLLGLALRDGYLQSEKQTLKEFYDLRKFRNYSPAKEEVTLENLATMTSTFTGNDDEEESPGNEEKMYPTSDWVKFALDLPMAGDRERGKDWSYFTAGVVLLGDIMHRSVPDGLEKFAEDALFRPLGISRYEWQYTPEKVVSTAGGLRLRALDLARFGQLYKNGGEWSGKQLLSRDWVKSSLARTVKLPSGEDEYYGRLFWNKSYRLGDRRMEVSFASGNGGNKIFIVKDQPLVVVITATAYGNLYGHRQADRMMEKYLLPAVLGLPPIDAR